MTMLQMQGAMVMVATRLRMELSLAEGGWDCRILSCPLIPRIEGRRWACRRWHLNGRLARTLDACYLRCHQWRGNLARGWNNLL